NAYPTMDSMGFAAVGFELDAQGAALMSELTSAHKGMPMAIVLDGRVISTPTIQSRIADHGSITGGRGGFSQAEMSYLLNTLSAGSLEARVSDEPISIKTTGPQLGQDNLHRGLQATIVSFICVCAFIGIYYM